MIVHAGMVRFSTRAPGTDPVDPSARAGPCATMPTRFPAGSLKEASRRGPSGVGSWRSTAPAPSASVSVSATSSTWIHITGPASGAGGRSVIHCPMSPGASKPDSGGSTSQPSTCS